MNTMRRSSPAKTSSTARVLATRSTPSSFHTVAMSLLVYGIAIPFFLVEHDFVPLSVGILSGAMWLPVS